MGSTFNKMGAAVVISLLVSHRSVDVCFCWGITEFTEYQEYLYLDGSFQKSNDQMSWLFVLAMLALLCAQRKEDWLCVVIALNPLGNLDTDLGMRLTRTRPCPRLGA